MEVSMIDQRKKLLYVEDDDSAWRVVHRWLRDSYVLLRAKNDVEACVMLRQFGPELAGVLCDIHLGGALTGLDLARMIRGTMDVTKLPEWAKDVPVLTAPVVIITGDPARAHQALDIELTSVLGKPIDFPSLLAVLSPPLGPGPYASPARRRVS
jgi:CheY-like chemotaxis protein